jgi:hypothetical protein
VSPSQWTNAYDWYFTGNKRDQMRLHEAEMTGMIDSTFFGGSFASEAYHGHHVMTKALKQLKKQQFEANKEEILKRVQEQEQTKRNRIEGFLRAANINVDAEPATLPLEARKNEGPKEVKSPVEAIVADAVEPVEEEAVVVVKKKENKVYKKKRFGEDKQDRIDSRFEFENSPPPLNPNASYFLANRVSIRNMIKPNFNSWIATLLTTTYAPDDIAIRKPIPYSSRNADNVHKFLEIAIDLQNPNLLVIAEKCCGIFAQTLPLELRQKYKNFKEKTLLSDAGIPN